MKYMTIDDALKTKYTVNDLPAYLATKNMPGIHRGNKKQAYYDMIVAFDIEATSFTVNDQPKATMYIWMVAIDGTFFYGRTWDEWMEFMNILNNWLCKGMPYTNDMPRLLVWVQNLSYEYQWIRKRFCWTKVFATDERKVVYAQTMFHCFEFRCSYFLSGYDLGTMGKNLTKHHIQKMTGDLDYSLMRHSDTPLDDKEMGYCINDVIVLSCYIAEELDTYKNFCLFPLTNTGRVRKYCREYCQRKDFKAYRKLMKKCVLNDVAEYEQLKDAFAGGFTHACSLYSGLTMKNVDSIDFTSSYPAVMLMEQFPMNKGVRVDCDSISEDELLNYLKYYCCVFMVEIWNIRETFVDEHYLSVSKCHEIDGHVEDNGRVVSADHLITTITNVDLEIMMETYEWDDIKFSNMIVYEKDYLPKEIIECVLKFYGDKTKLKGVAGREVEYLHGKGMLNSMYGMAVTDILNNLIDYDDNTDSWESLPVDKEEVIEKYNKSKNRFLSYVWGIFVTAYARRNLWTGILEFGSTHDYLYADTDSNKVLNIMDHMDYINDYDAEVEKKLRACANHYNLDFELFQPETIKGVKKMIGVWDWETKGNPYKRFKTLGAKRYMEEDNDGLTITIAGVSKSKGAEYLSQGWCYDIITHEEHNSPFDKFVGNSCYNDVGLSIPGDYSGKMIHAYIDDEFEADLTDYMGVTSHVHEMSAVNLSKTGYVMSLADKYVRFLQGRRQYVK